jgi:hypothetical protein
MILAVHYWYWMDPLRSAVLGWEGTERRRALCLFICLSLSLPLHFELFF